jgi:hypothetical protein
VSVEDLPLDARRFNELIPEGQERDAYIRWVNKVVDYRPVLRGGLIREGVLALDVDLVEPFSGIYWAEEDWPAVLCKRVYVTAQPPEPLMRALMAARKVGRDDRDAVQR